MSSNNILPFVEQKIFAQDATPDYLVQFGTAKTENPVKTTDVAQLQNNAAYLQGWQAAVLASKAPFMEEMNGVLKSMSYNIRQSQQEIEALKEGGGGGGSTDSTAFFKDYTNLKFPTDNTKKGQAYRYRYTPNASTQTYTDGLFYFDGPIPPGGISDPWTSYKLREGVCYPLINNIGAELMAPAAEPYQYDFISISNNYTTVTCPYSGYLTVINMGTAAVAPQAVQFVSMRLLNKNEPNYTGNALPSGMGSTVSVGTSSSGDDPGYNRHFYVLASMRVLEGQRVMVRCGDSTYPGSYADCRIAIFPFLYADPSQI